MASGRQIPHILSPRMLCSCLLLGAYQYELKYRPGKDHQPTDALSRPPLPSPENEPVRPEDILMIEAMHALPLTALNIAEITSQDDVLCAAYEGVQKESTTEWVASQFAAFTARQTEQSTHKECVLWGSRVVLPKSAQDAAMEMLHANYRGMTLMN